MLLRCDNKQALLKTGLQTPCVTPVERLHASPPWIQKHLPQRRPMALSLCCVVLLLFTALWNGACFAASSQIVEQAFVSDTSGQMTLDQVRQQPETSYTGALARVLSTSVVWVRLRVAPSSFAEFGASERLLVLPIWSQSLTLYDPLQRDAGGHLRRLDTQPASGPYALQSLAIPVGTEPRDLWLRLDPGGSTYLKTMVLSIEEDKAKVLSDGVLQGVLIGGQAFMVIIGLGIWLADRKGIGQALLIKQVLNFTMTLTNADLLFLAIRTDMLPWQREGMGSPVVECMRLLNLAVSLWFFIKVQQLFKASPRALLLLRLLLAVILLCPLLIWAGQLALLRLVFFGLYMTIALGLVASSLTFEQKPLPSNSKFSLVKRRAQQAGFSLVIGISWTASLSAGFYKTQHISFFGLLTPIYVMCALGVLLLVGWQRMQTDRQLQVEHKRQAELNAIALDFERGERQRQQEFMAMLTHELKGPLSTLGMVIGSPAASSTMQRHAVMALASMRQVIEHCAQSAHIEDNCAPPQQVACSLAVELKLRCEAQVDKSRLRNATADPMPQILADPRMLAVIFNNLLDNAFKYAPKGSPIHVGVVRERTPEGAMQRVRISNHAPDGPMPDAAQLFQKYYRGEGVQRINGSGLGLHLSRLLARRQGGDLLYQPEDSWITFTLVLPESRRSAAADS